MTRTFCPARRRPARRPCRAASPEIATAAACSKLSLSGQPGYYYGGEFEIGLDLILDSLERTADRP